MRGILLLNGEAYGGEIDADGAYVVCCDGAYNWARGRVKIDENVGDFDSVLGTPTPAPTEIYPAEKDCTDGELALRRLISLGVDSIEIYGGGGKREDHFIGNLHLLYAAKKAGVPARMYTKNSCIFIDGGKIDLSGLKGKTLSVLPFGSALHIKNSAGLKYEYPEVIAYGECRGLSNVATENGAFVEIGDSECALIIVNGGEV